MQKKKLMTQKEYLKNSGLKCPKCSSDDITSDHIDVDGMSGYASINCYSCDFSWKDIWTLTGYETDE